MDINIFKRLHRRHRHKIAGSMALAGVALIIFPEPVVTNAIGTILIFLALAIASIEDKIKRKRK